MTQSANEPLNSLETAVRAGVTGERGGADLIQQLLKSKIFVPSAKEVQQDGRGLVPLMLRSSRGGEMVAAFTNLSRIGPLEKQQAPFCLEVSGEWLIRNLAADLGIVLFAGPNTGCEIPQEGLSKVRQELTAREE